MTELTTEQYQKTFSESMKRFELSNLKWIEKIKNLASDFLIVKGIAPTNLVLEYCYENSNETFSHYLVNYGLKNKYLAIISNEIEEEWFGYYFLDIDIEYGIIKKAT